MIGGILMALAAGTLVSVQNLFNNKVGAAVSSQATSALVLGMGFAASLAMGLLFEGGDLFATKPMHAWFWFSGLLGIGVVACMVSGMKLLGPSYAVSIAMASQLLCALWWDSAGWFGLDRVPFMWQKGIGVVLLIAGLLLFKARKPAPAQGDAAQTKAA